ncbi:MAG: hypothetical protein DMG50_10515 [Acidobacteria bacterium]|nr:MAG: hypothetical protein DMG50_10515 [Acidobacteriota bacterium]
MPIRKLPSIHAGGSGSGSGSGRYSSSGSNSGGWTMGCSGVTGEIFCSVINQLFYHTRQAAFLVACLCNSMSQDLRLCASLP